ncbi:thioredoxin domain-containing protein [Tuwongella immobilis]|nr:thioredoxin domain-containing protein [Tuwongella immobilis]
MDLLNPRRNRLAQESSLYLRQHASNPVDWYPWGDEALEQARLQQKPIFLSVGYSACHWCHVMERESFENPVIAQYLNSHFINIKVDREERPDVDSIYMTALQMLTREGGGWPLSVWMTPDLKPFFAGTYFPPDSRYGPRRPPFLQVLRAILEAWNERREDLLRTANDITDSLREATARQFGDGPPLGPELLEHARHHLQRAYDAKHGGFGTPPKFPHALELQLLMRWHARTHDADAREMVRFTLQQMGRGGIFDQLNGGFARYSTDARWLVPHFEKMLYDNALLAATYAESVRAFGDPFDAQILRQTLDYVRREMTSPEGGFYSAQDADSNGEEGEFYVWTASEIDEILGPDLAPLAKSVWGVTASGNFEGRNILHRTASDADDAAKHGLELGRFREQMDQCKRLLRSVQAQRILPKQDQKILTAWNGLMIAAFAEGAMALDDPILLETAQRAADFVLRVLRNSEGRLARTTTLGMPAKLNGYLEDYAFLMHGLLALYHADFQPRWLQAVVELADLLVTHFADSTNGGFFFTADDHEQLLVRTKDVHDGSTPSGSAMAVTTLLKLAVLTSREDWYALAGETLTRYATLMHDSPSSSGQMLMALDFFLGPVREIVIVGDIRQVETRQTLRLLHQRFAPNDLLIFHDPNEAETPLALLPMLAERSMIDNRVTAYICENYTCQSPIVGFDAIRTAMTGP